MAATIYFGSMVMPYTVTLLLAILARLLVTGALHEDGLADFCDGFGGGGHDRDRILAIMKDSHIGTYGVIGLIFYFALLYTTLLSLPADMAALAVLAADPYAKMVASQLILMMPYARNEETAKSHTVYRRPDTKAGILLAIQGLTPLALFLWLMHDMVVWSTLVFVPCIAMYFLYLLMWRRIKGYTGDCFGAACVLVELTFYLLLLL